jgi:hypothetical protein
MLKCGQYIPTLELTETFFPQDPQLIDSVLYDLAQILLFIEVTLKSKKIQIFLSFFNFKV